VGRQFRSAHSSKKIEMKTNLLILLLFCISHFAFAQSFNEIKKSAEEGYAIAQYNLGVMYFNGVGTLTDKKQSADWTRKSCENGYEPAKEFWDKYELYKY
tara:strand:+ start:1211 stop:1510 length:300 start_codon:yes stop_codon:yes gene_type:complete